MDHMRISGPEQSVAPGPKPAEIEGGKAAAKPAGGADGRVDGRPNDQLRKIFCRPGVVSQAGGSAYIEVGNTKIVAACYGPRDLLRTREYSASGKLSCEFKYAPFACKNRRSYIQDDEERELSVAITQALSHAVRLDQYPKSLIDIYITVLENDGSDLAAAITCASMALADAGIEMYDLVAGCTMVEVGGQVVLDPTVEELQGSNHALTIAYMPAFDEVSGVVQSGEMNLNIFSEAVQACVAGCAQVNLVQQTSLRTANEGGDGSDEAMASTKDSAAMNL